MTKVKRKQKATKGEARQTNEPAPPEYKLNPGWEVIMTDDKVVPKKPEEMVAMFGEAYMAFASYRKGMAPTSTSTQRFSGYMPMRLGAVEVRPDIPVEMLESTKSLMKKQGLSERPRVQFPQGQRDICVAAAVASALYAAGLKMEADTVMQWSNDDIGMTAEDPMLHVKKVLKNDQFGGYSHIQTTRFNADNIRLLQDDNSVRKIEPWVIFVVAVVDSNKKADHAIAIYNEWIYDANMQYAIPYNRCGLDFITKTATIDKDTGKTYNPTSTTFQKARIAYGIYESRKRNVKNLSWSTAVREDMFGESPPPSKPWKTKQTKKAKK